MFTAKQKIRVLASARAVIQYWMTRDISPSEALARLDALYGRLGWSDEVAVLHGVLLEATSVEGGSWDDSDVLKGTFGFGLLPLDRREWPLEARECYGALDAYWRRSFWSDQQLVSEVTEDFNEARIWAWDMILDGSLKYSGLYGSWEASPGERELMITDNIKRMKKVRKILRKYSIAEGSERYFADAVSLLDRLLADLRDPRARRRAIMARPEIHGN